MQNRLLPILPSLRRGEARPFRFPTNSGSRGRGIFRGAWTCGLVLMAACFSGPLYARPPRPNLFSKPRFLYRGGYSSGLFRPAWNATSGKRRLPASFSEFGFSVPHFRNNEQNMLRPDFGDRLTEPARAPENLPLRNRLLAWEAGKIDLPAGNMPFPSDGLQNKKANSDSSTGGSPGHIFWVIPAFKVVYGEKFKPLTPKEKFEEWARGSYDPMGLTVGAFEAGTLEYSSTDGFCGYGQGWGGYGECFGSLELDATDSSFIGDFVLPVVLHQDPRFFRLNKGSFGKRVWYSISRVFVTYNDSGQTVFYSSALSGTVIAAVLSNLYYPSQDVGVSHTMTRIAIDLGNTALYNLAAEFWPNIDQKIHHTF